MQPVYEVMSRPTPSCSYILPVHIHDISITNAIGNEVTLASVCEVPAGSLDRDLVPESHSNSLEDLKKLFTESNMTRSDMRSVLCLIRKYVCNVPIDPRSLLSTPRSCNTVSMSNGVYVHFGLKKSVERILGGHIDSLNEVRIQLSIDGMCIFKDSDKSLWPIQCRLIKPMKSVLFLIGAYCGRGKPNPIDTYLFDTTSELKDLLARGAKLECVVCDAPARAFVKRVKTYTGYHGCDRCNIKGRYVANRVLHIEHQGEKRSDNDFRSRKCMRHHTVRHQWKACQSIW